MNARQILTAACALLVAGCANLPAILSALTAAGGAPTKASPAPSPAATPAKTTVPEPTDPVELINAWMVALTSGDEEAAAVAILPYVHKTLKNFDQTALSTDVRQFSFRKAFNDAKYYSQPVVITRIRPNEGTTAIGFGATAEAGHIDDYFIGRKDAATGMPAPVAVFTPASGAPPKISYVGNL